jgi:hypothetical protein
LKGGRTQANVTSLIVEFLFSNNYSSKFTNIKLENCQMFQSQMESWTKDQSQ